MKKSLLYLLTLFIISCGTDKKQTSLSDPDFNQKETIDKIDKLEAVLFNAENKALNLKEAREILKTYKYYAKQLPLDAKTPDYLFKAGEVHMGLAEHKLAIGTFANVYTNYQNFDKRVECLYLQAFIYDSYLDQKGKAKEIYEEIIERHPQHKLAQDAIAALDILTLSDEELINMLEEKNKEQLQNIE